MRTPSSNDASARPRHGGAVPEKTESFAHIRRRLCRRNKGGRACAVGERPGGIVPRRNSSPIPRSLLRCAKTVVIDSSVASLPQRHQVTAHLPISRRDRLRHQRATTYHTFRGSPCLAIRPIPSSRSLPGTTTSLPEACHTILYRKSLSCRKTRLPPKYLLYPKACGRSWCNRSFRGLGANAKSKCLREVPMSGKCFWLGTVIRISALKRRISHCGKRRSTWASVEACFFGCWAFPFPSSSCWRCSGTTNTSEARLRPK